MSSRRITPEQFETYVEEALASVPPQFRTYLDNVVIVVEEEPLPEDFEQTGTPEEEEELFGIFRGSSYFERSQMISDLPGQIAIFRGPILRSCTTRGEAVREIRDTVVHELGHVLGLEDGEMPY